MRLTLTLGLFIFTASPVAAEWCNPPIPPLPTAEAVAREYREELKSQFDQYFIDASHYTTCLDNERARIIEEMRDNAQRYDRFLEDSAGWTD